MKTHKRLKNIMFCRFLTKIAFVFLFAAYCLLTAYAEVSHANESIDSLITYKTFPFYNYVAHNQVFADIIKKDPVLKNQGARQVKRIKMALEHCDNVDCYATAVQWNPDEIAAIGNRLIRLCHDNPKMRRLLPLLKAGDHYNLYNTQIDAAFIWSVWNDAALGVNRILDTYIKGRKPRYPDIDSISFQIDRKSVV